MKNIITVNNLSFWYPGRDLASLKKINLSINAGEFILLTGSTGCGKSTLLKCFNGIIPHLSGGQCQGAVNIKGRDTRTMTMAELSAQTGLVQQSPDDQIFATVIQDEVAFGPENLCLEPTEIKKRLEWALNAVDLKVDRLQSTAALSGGQKQRLAIAAMMALKPEILALDEPISQLDPQGAAEVMEVIQKLNREYGITVIMVEHRIHEVAQYVSRIIVMDSGQVALDAPTRQVMSKTELFAKMGLRLPETVEISSRIKNGCVAMTVEETVDLLKGGHVKAGGTINSTDSHHFGFKDKVLEINDLFYSYNKKSGHVLNGLNITLCKGEKLAVMGRNGSGKSTLLAHMAALITPQKGTVKVAGKSITKKQKLSFGTVGMVMQNPDLMLFQSSVRREIEFGLRNLKAKTNVLSERYNQAVEGLTLRPFQDDPPLALSRGQRLRTAIAAIVAMRPEIVFLDEPTTGQDKQSIESMMETLLTQVETLVFCTHDIGTALSYATRVIVLDQGNLVADGAPRQVFSDICLLKDSGLKPTQTWLIGRQLGVEGVFTPTELIERWVC